MKVKIVVLGAGPGGYVAAIRAAQLGGDVTVIEKENVGGTCLNWGCIPSKIYKQSADTLNSIKDSASFCIDGISEGKLNLERLQERTKGIIASQSKGIHGLLAKNSISYIGGEAKMSGSHSLSVTRKDGETEEVQFDKLIIATGSTPMALPFLPFDGDRILSSDHIFSLKEIPESITIIGGGVIGCEFACILQSFGVEVTLVEGLERLLPLPSVEEECSKLLLREMKKKKIKVELKTTLASASQKNGMVQLNLVSQGKNGTEKAKQIESEKVLVCIGRRASSASLDLDQAGVETTKRGWISTGANLQTTVPHIYAIGDVLGPERIMLAHTASTEAEIAAENCFGGAEEMNWQVMPSAIFTMPEIGCVGLSEAQAAELYGKENIRAESSLFRTLGKAQVIGELAGVTKIVCAKEDGKILGIHIAGAHATDLLGEATLAVSNGITAKQLTKTIHAHPTLAEILLETAFKIEDMPLHG
ncbi:dihydrolipoyl dehydrogenase [Desulfotalea psychrophila]|nr:dihydrolipoyl dehydrogenase [Desulfotalea psychrophila]